MRKVLFLMFLLLLMVLGAAGVKAQVRIGGNGAPNAGAVLDLNATDGTNNGTKGLALPRVALTSNTMLLSGETSNLTGMMVYNTSTTGGAGVNRIGIYYWNGATWVQASLPSTSALDTGKLLMSNGSSWILAPGFAYVNYFVNTTSSWSSGFGYFAPLPSPMLGVCAWSAVGTPGQGTGTATGAQAELWLTYTAQLPTGTRIHVVCSGQFQ